MICPKCKTQNDDNSIVCGNCGFKLRLKCPSCGEYNLLGARTCPHCSVQLLVNCPHCGVVNFANSVVCRKCQKPLNQSVKSETEEVKVRQNVKYATVAVELINFSAIKTNIKSAEIVQKVINKFYQIFAKSAKTLNFRPLKLSATTLITEIAAGDSFDASVQAAVAFVENIDNQLRQVSDILEKKLKISYKIKYSITSFKPVQKQNIIEAMGLGVVNDIIFSEDTYLILKGNMPFKPVKSESGLTFYKFIDMNDPETMTVEQTKEQYVPTRLEIISDLVKRVQAAPNGYVACINGPMGIGKSYIYNILKLTYEEDNSNIWLMGQCSLATKYSSLAFFRDLLRNIFDLPAVNIDIENLKLKVVTYLKDILKLEDEIITNDILGILFYDETKLQNQLFQNKQSTYNAIATLFRSVLNQRAVVLQIEDIEFIDPFSLEILRSLFDDGILNCNLKIFITSDLDIDIMQFFASVRLTRDNTFFINYPGLTKEEIDEFIQKAIGIKDELGENLLAQIYENAKGLPVVVEEFLYFLLQIGLLKFDKTVPNRVIVSEEAKQMTMPKTVQEIIQQRLIHISQTKPNAFKAVYYASIMGMKFMPAVLQNILKIENDEMTDIITYLSMDNLIAAFDSYNYVFKNRSIWQTVRSLTLTEENQISALKLVTDVMTQITKPDSIQMITNLNEAKIPKPEMLTFIEQATKEAYAIGDDYAYVYYKKMLLEAVQESEIENKDSLITSIKEELVYLTYLARPEEALQFATELLETYQADNVYKTIDLLGYMSVSFENIGNYLATLDCADKALEKIDGKGHLFAPMLLNYSKLPALFMLGRFGELINLVKINIIPSLEEYKKNHSSINTSLDEDDINYIELNTYYFHGLALAFQGNSECLNVLNRLNELAAALNNNDFSIKAQLAVAAFRLLQADINEVEKNLETIQPAIPSTTDSNYNTFLWFFLKNMSGYMQNNLDEIRNELVMLSNFAGNIRQCSFDPVIKGISAKILLENGRIEDAKNIFYELFYEASNNQWALGSLINWYFYVDVLICEKSYDEALKFAQNALEVAEKATIDNIFFTALLKTKIAEIYLLKEDYDMSNINAQEALKIAEKYGYSFVIARLGGIIADILSAQAKLNPSLKVGNMQGAYKITEYAKQAADKVENKLLIIQLQQKQEIIRKFCDENAIDITVAM